MDTLEYRIGSRRDREQKTIALTFTDGYEGIVPVQLGGKLVAEDDILLRRQVLHGRLHYGNTVCPGSSDPPEKLINIFASENEVYIPTIINSQ